MYNWLLAFLGLGLMAYPRARKYLAHKVQENRDRALSKALSKQTEPELLARLLALRKAEAEGVRNRQMLLDLSAALSAHLAATAEGSPQQQQQPPLRVANPTVANPTVAPPTTPDPHFSTFMENMNELVASLNLNQTAPPPRPEDFGRASHDFAPAHKDEEED